jgi:hypothetical protein
VITRRSLLAAALAARGVEGGPQSGSKSASEWLVSLSLAWDEAKWEQGGAGRPGYMRPLGDPGARYRMAALRGAVAEGKKGAGALVAALEHGDGPQRVFAAQALGYLAPDAPRDPLARAAQQDPDPAVRLHAVDALAKQGGSLPEWAALPERERNPDVRRHLGYARERQGAQLAAEVARRLVAWDPATYDSATVGRPAPDFELRAAGGAMVRLSAFRGKAPVVLVFVYGDT